MSFIDSHCHLNFFFKKNTISLILQRALKASVHHCINVGTSFNDWNLYYELAIHHKNQLSYTVGIHPLCINLNWRNELNKINDFFLSKVPPVAIGEIGLDYFYLPKEKNKAESIKKLQINVFSEQLKLALKFNCPIIIHSRNAFQACIDIIEFYKINWNLVIFHCFTEGPKSINMLNERGGIASFTGIVTYKNAESIRKAALAQGVDKLILETDSPYLAPMPYRSKTNEPAYIKNIAEFCALLFGVDIETIKKHTNENTRLFFNLC